MRKRRGISGTFQLDELETYEHSRLLAPVTVPVVIERSSFFVVDLEVAPLPCRGRLSEMDRVRKRERERVHGVRKSGSREAVKRCFDTLAAFHAPGSAVAVDTDRKSTYPGLLKRCLGSRVRHLRHSSTAKRDYGNPLFPINHTLAMLRDGVSRLVRRTWAASKLRQRLALHAWMWIAWRNYIRGITNQSPATSPAMALHVETRQWSVTELCAWRVPLAA